MDLGMFACYILWHTNISKRRKGLVVPVCLLTEIRTAQELLDHMDIQATMIYTHLLNRDGRGVRSPFDTLRL